SLRCAGRSFSRVARTRAWIRSRGRRAPSAVSRRFGSVVKAEFIMLASHLAPLGRHVPIQPSDIGIVSRFGFYLAFVGSDAELFRLRLRCHMRQKEFIRTALLRLGKLASKTAAIRTSLI